MSQQNLMTDKEISILDVFTFLKIRFMRIFICGAVSLGICLLVLMIFYMFSPRSTHYKRNIVLLLPKSGKMVCYPSGKPFSSADLISPLILLSVYDTYKLKDRIDFKQFCSFFSITNSDVHRDELDAEYRQKMAQKNISVVDLQNLERQYKLKLQTFSIDVLCITLSPQIGLRPEEAAKILDAVAENWFRIYSRLEAEQYPQVEMNFLKQEFSQHVERPGYLIELEKTRVYCRKLQLVCTRLNDMLQGKNTVLENGEFLGDILNQLHSIEKYQISVFRQYVLRNPSYQGVLDKLFIYSNLQNIESDLIRINSKYESTMVSIDMLQTKSLVGSGVGMEKKNAGGNDMKMLTADHSFFNQFADMVRNDKNNTLRAISARKALKLGDERANLEADKIYFQQLLGAVSTVKEANNESSVLNQEQFGLLLKKMYTDLFEVSEKVILFRNKIVRDYLTSREFYVSIGNVQYRSDFRYSFSRFSIGIMGLWLLFNLIFVTFEFSRFCSKRQNSFSC